MRVGVARRAAMAGLVAAGILTMAACAPVPSVIDTPKDGDRIAIAVDQPLQVRWSNQSPDHGAWVLETGPATGAVAAAGRTTERPAGAAFALDVFDFKGAQKGTDSLTFIYRRKDGSPPALEERVTVSVAVSS